MGEDRLLTLAEAATITGYTQRRLRQLAAKHVLPADKFGKTYIVRESALNRFIETHQPAIGRPRGSRNKPPAASE
jgi:excisionase family DNA binding protein